MSRIDWAGLLRVGLHDLRLEPAVFWRLTPLELQIMLGTQATVPPLTRVRLEELAAAFPDIKRGTGDDPDRRVAGTGQRA